MERWLPVPGFDGLYEVTYCENRVRLTLEMGNYPLECTLPAGHPGQHYDAAFSWSWMNDDNSR